MKKFAHISTKKSVYLCICNTDTNSYDFNKMLTNSSKENTQNIYIVELPHGKTKKWHVPIVLRSAWESVESNQSLLYLLYLQWVA